MTPNQQQFVAWSAITAVAGLVLWVLSPVLMPFVVAAALAYVLSPLVKGLLRISAGALPVLLAVGVVELLFLVLALAILLLVVPILAKELPLMREQLPGLLLKAQAVLAPWLKELGIEMALDYAQRLRCPRIHILAGLVPEAYRRPPRPDEVCDTHGPLARESGPLRDTFLTNLRWAARLAAQQGCDVLIEPINTRDIAHYFLNRQADAHAIVAEVGEPNLKVQMDLYHCQVVEGDVAAKVRAYLPTGRVGHFQIAGAPQRQEPDAGEQNYTYLLDVIDEVSQACGWQGWVGCEYRPARGEQSGATHTGLEWLRRWRAQHPSVI